LVFELFQLEPLNPMTAKTIVTCFPLDETHVEKIRETAKTDIA